MAKTDSKPLPELTEYDVERFWQKVDKRGPDECWLWTATTVVRGYGVMSFKGRGGKFYAHRISFRIANGYDPAAGDCCHKCDVPTCVNPAHLFAGSHLMNMQDGAAKGRWPSGENHHSHKRPEAVQRGEEASNAKLKDAEVIEIRRLYATGALSMSKVGARFGVGQVTVHRIVHRDTWKHLP